jgi:hypothetical protein
VHMAFPWAFVPPNFWRHWMFESVVQLVCGKCGYNHCIRLSKSGKPFLLPNLLTDPS